MPMEESAEEEYYLVVDEEELLVVRRVLQSKREEEQSWLKHIFHTRGTMKRKECSIIIDENSCENVVAT